MSETSASQTVLPRGAPRWVFFALFTVSGFSGLIYESIWSHYLKLFLGHAAYAQSLVLMIFMGGMAAGSWLASRWSPSRRSPILFYAAVEAIIGLLALGFHETFVALTAAFYDTILPATSVAAAGAALKWASATLLIVPQSVLLGMTFPLMSAGVIRRFPAHPGGTLAMLYFTNSIGAAIGVLASGLWLIGLVGLPGTIRTAGAINLVLAAVVALLAREDGRPGSADPAATDKVSPAPEAAHADEGSVLRPSQVHQLFLLAAFVTGWASFIYEIGWIRMLSLVLGSSTHAFELMLSAFITGLALGGLWIRGRVDWIASPLRFSGNVQVVMGILAALSIPVYGESFQWMGALLVRLPKTDNGYLAFTLASHAIAMAVMLPATFAAGMTLPLFTHVMMKSGAGEAAIGRIYAANTLGAIAGVLFAVHVGLPWLGLKNLIGVGALLDVGLGLLLLAFAYGALPTGRRALARDATVALGAIGLVVAFSDVGPQRLASGVFRHGRVELPAGATVEFYRDGKTSSVAVVRNTTETYSISTNGKPDASIQVNPVLPPAADEYTMTLAAVLPLAYKPDARRIANIGFGSGLTTHVLLGDAQIERLDTVEIEPAMVEGARRFGRRVERAFTDPRSHIHIEDAKTFFPLQRQTYDVIIAEPSNPWVSGVASLFSREFYGLIGRFLAADGIMAQWVQVYEFNDELFFSIMKALDPHFSDFVIFSSAGFDAIIIARKSGRLSAPDFKRVFTGGMMTDLRRVDLTSATGLMSHQIATASVVRSMLPQFQAPANSDYYPYVELHAPSARFMGRTAETVLRWSLGSGPRAGTLRPGQSVPPDETRR
jgi:predicted membrane-bound spermidine synthase